MSEQIIVQQAILLLKFQILNHTSEDLIKIYNDPEKYEDFLIGFNYLLNQEEGFWLVKEDILEKLITANQTLRGNIKTEEINTWCNTLIEKVNRLLHSPSELKDYQARKFLAKELKLRKYDSRNIDGWSTFSDLLSFDYVTYSYLQDQTYEELYNEEFFLTSTNALLKTMPDWYRQNPFFLDATKEIILESLSSPQELEDPKQYQKMAKKTLHQVRHLRGVK